MIDETNYCPSCAGSGEGMWDGSSCGECHGAGEIPVEQED